MDSIIVCGMQFGDEGKGTFIDYLAHERKVDSIIRYNGGSQSSHTVITPNGKLHKFSQLGSGMFLEKCHTYITENMVINLDNLMVEIEFFSEATGIAISEIIPRIHIHENCYIVTPYHKLLNKLRELSKGSKRRGSVGTGVSEVTYLLSEKKHFSYEYTLGVQVKDIYQPNDNYEMIEKLKAVQTYVEQFYKEHQSDIWNNMPEGMKKIMEKEIEYLLTPKAFLQIAYDYIIRLKYAAKDRNLKQCIYQAYELSFRKNCKCAVWEGSQGLLIDGVHGIKPNTTLLDTTNHFALSLAYRNDKITNVGIAKAFNSRHGLGVFPTETTEVSNKISDKNQDESFWNGKIRFGWFDTVLLRYAQKVNQVEELYLSCVDQLSCFETVKICNAYYYDGVVDENFVQTFEYEIIAEGKIHITNIKENSKGLSEYLAKCMPEYIELPGWKQDITKITKWEELPQNCKEYIFLLEQLTKLPITMISVGATRENKIKRKA